MKIKQKLLALSVSIGLGAFLYSPAVLAVETSVLPKDLDIMGLLILIINILTGAIGIVAVGGVIYGAIIYTQAGGSMEEVKRAKKIIANVVMGLAAYVLMYSFLQYLIPGGVFNNL
jgi:hypothetical protein